MKYQVNATMMFNLEADAVAFINLIEQVKDKVCTDEFKGGIDNDLKCTMFKCYHDEVPPKQCEMVNYVDFKAVKAEVKTEAGKVITYTSLDVTPKETIKEVIK